jgi:hypothetical protein
MGFSKYAKATFTNPVITQAGWDDVRSKAFAPAPTFEVRRASQIILQQYDPAQYLLSHCTIIASVDTEKPGLPTGNQMFDGLQINRQFPDFYVTTGTAKYVNNNQDCWERKLLLASFRTFIGGENYVEHIQIPELSKGKIIDAAARDIGESVYVDILIATDRKHKSLIEAITSGQLSTLSMGCFLPEAPVTLADGRRVSIKDVMPGEMVLTHKGRSREVLNQQIHIGKWGMRRIKVVGIPDAIPTTDNHPFYVVRPSRTCACGCGQTLEVSDRDPVRRMTKRFRVGHQLRVLNPNGSYSIEEARDRKRQLEEISSLKIEKLRSDELQVGDYVVFPKLSTEVVGDPGVARARLLGYFLAEGSFLKKRGNPVEVQFNFSLTERLTLVEETVQLLKESFPGCIPWVQDRVDRCTCVVHVTGKNLVSWFKKHGGEYSHRKHLSSEAMQWSAESHRNILGAWLNGDGGLQVSGSVAGTTTSYDLICQLHLLAIQCDLPARIECFFGGGASTIEVAVVNGESIRHPDTGKLAHFNLMFSKSASDPLLGVCAKAPTQVHDRHLRVLDDIVIFPITGIEPFQYEGAVYNIEVEEDHSYQVGGVAVGNCHVSFTICTKCGNVAEDETQLCRHIKYEKGNWFLDAKGQRRKIAELCGHITKEPGSVKFIEGSWVAHPAFSGAVLRSILDPKTAELAEAARHKIQVAYMRPTEVFDPNLMQKAARLAPIGVGAVAKPADYLAYLHDGPSLGALRVPPPFSGTARAAEAHRSRLQQIKDAPRARINSAQQDFPGQSEMGGSPSSTPSTEDSTRPFKQVINDLYHSLVDEVTNKVKKDISDSDKGEESTLDENRSNESLIKSALRYAKWRERSKMVLANVKDPSKARSVLAGLILHDMGGWEAVGKANRFSGREILVMNRLIERTEKKSSMAGDARIYRTVIALGGTASYPDVDSYLAACREVLGRTLTNSEMVQLVTKGKLFSLGLR